MRKRVAPLRGFKTFPEVSEILELQKLVWAREQELRTLLTPRNALLFPGGLLGASSDANARPRNLGAAVVNAFSAPIRSHSVFKWLQHSTGYAEAAKALAQRTMGDDSREALAEIIFLDCALTWFALTVSGAKSGWRPKGASNSQKESAIKHAQSLAAALENLSFEDFEDTATLKRMLMTLCSELQNKSKRNYSGPKARERLILIGLAYSLLRVPGLSETARRRARTDDAPIVEIVKHLATVYGLDVGHRTVQRYVAEARKRQRESLARALEKYVPAPGK
jgi:hypothetical protein